jgi:hypothetical protein
MQPREYHDGAQDGLEALEPLDPEKVRSFSDLLVAMRKTAFGARRLGEAYEVLTTMIGDPDCFVVLTLSGAMTIEKMGKIITSKLGFGPDEVSWFHDRAKAAQELLNVDAPFGSGMKKWQLPIDYGANARASHHYIHRTRR